MSQTSPLSKLFLKLIKLINKYNPTQQDCIQLVAWLTMSMGASIEGIPIDNLPTFPVLAERHAEKPTLGIAMILSGYHMLSWIEDLKIGSQEQKKP